MISMKIKETLQNYKRVLQISKKPEKSELIETARICAIGISIIGLIGFTLYFISIIITQMPVG